MGNVTAERPEAGERKARAKTDRRDVRPRATQIPDESGPAEESPVESATSQGPATGPAVSATAFLDRLFAPHGAAAYIRRLPGARILGGDPPARPENVGAATSAAGSRAATPTATMTTAVPPATRRRTATGAHQVTFEAAGLSAVAEGSLLETAEAAGLEPRNRCRRGICGTCTTTKLSGTVLDRRTGETTEGHEPIRICVSEARGPVCLDL